MFQELIVYFLIKSLKYCVFSYHNEAIWMLTKNLDLTKTYYLRFVITIIKKENINIM